MNSFFSDKPLFFAAIHYEYQAVYPKGIEVKFIAKLNREFMKARL